MLKNRRDELEDANLELAKAEKQIEHMKGIPATANVPAKQ